MFLELFAFVISRFTFAKVKNVVHELSFYKKNSRNKLKLCFEIFCILSDLQLYISYYTTLLLQLVRFFSFHHCRFSLTIRSHVLCSLYMCFTLECHCFMFMLIEGNYFSYLFERRQTVNSLPLYLLINEHEFNSTFAATEICDNVSNDW